MAGWKVYDFECACGAMWEDITREGTSLCPECGECCNHVISGCRANTLNLLSKDDYKASMLKRSAEHTQRMRQREEFPAPRKPRKTA